MADKTGQQDQETKPVASDCDAVNLNQAPSHPWLHIPDVFKNHPYVLVLVACIAFQFALLGGTGSLTSGYHFMDDHQILEIDHDLATKGSVFKVATEWAAKDFNIRFRQLYYLHRVIETAVFGTNLTAWSVYHGLLVAVTAFLLFCFAKLWGFSWPAALFFPALALIGRQGEIACRLGPAETIGIFFCAGALAACVGRFRAGERASQLLTIATVFLAASASLCKESFILALPALAFVAVWLARRRDGCPGWWQALRSQLALVVALGAIGLIEIVVILKWVGSNKIGYAGVDSATMSLANLWTPLGGPRGFLTHKWLWAPALGIFAAWVWSAWQNRNPLYAGIKLGRELAAPMALASLIVLPQVVLYAKSGQLAGRYMVPGMFGIAFVAVWMLDYVRGLNLNRWLGWVLIALLLLGLAVSLKREIAVLRLIAHEGRSTTAFMSRIRETTETDSAILIVADRVDNYEQAFAAHAYLVHMLRRGNLFISVFDEPKASIRPRPESLLVANIEKRYANRTMSCIPNKQEIRCIAILPGGESRFLEAGRDWFVREDYDRWVRSLFGQDGDADKMVVYSRKAP